MKESLRRAVEAVLDKAPGKKVPMVDLEEAASLVLRHNSSYEAMERLRELLEELSEREKIKLPSRKGKYWNRQRDLPEYVTVLNKEKDEENRLRKEAIRRIKDKTAWHHRLIGIASEQTKLESLELLEKINCYFTKRNGSRIPIPHRERALQIFGNEKALDGHVPDGPLMGKISLDDLDCFYCPEPLPFEPLSMNQAKTTGKPLLVVENSATYWSCCEANKTLLCFAAVVYGKGFKIGNAKSACDGLNDIEKKLRSDGVWYFGDLDPAGIHIPCKINAVRKKMGLFELEPALPLYRALLAKGIVTDKEKPQDKYHNPDWAVGWLGHELSGKYLERVDSKRWPQEGLSANDIIAAFEGVL